MKKDRGRLKAGLKTRIQETYETKDAGWGKSIFNQAKISGVALFKPGTGEHVIDILPYFAGSQDPHKREGDSTYLVDLWAHQNIGPNEDNFICLSKTYDKPCPVCEHRAKLRRMEERTEEVERDIEYCRPKRRTIYAIWDRDNESKGVQVWEVAHFFMQANLMAIVRKPRAGGYIAFSDPDKEEGRHISFKIEGARQQQKYTGFQLFEREEDIPDEILDQVPCLDELIQIPDYSEVKKAFWAGLESPDRPVTKVAKEVEACPYGGVIGEDLENFEECLSACKKYTRCHELYKQLYPEGEEEIEEEEGEETAYIPEPPPAPVRIPTRRRL